MKIKKIIEIILTAVLSSASFIQMINSSSVDEFFKNRYVIAALIICATALGVILVVDLHNIFNTVHKFKKGSVRFCKYFAKWYSKPGVLTLICDDLNWTSREIKGKTPILDALDKKAKDKELVLYLKYPDRTSASILQRLSNVTINNAQENIVNNYSFSCLNYMGNNSAVIVRDKKKDSGEEILFQEVADTYVTQLLNAILEV